ERARADRRHAAVDRVEAVRIPQEVRRRLAGAPDARQLDDVSRMDAHLEERVDDALGNRVMAAARTERRLAAAIGLDFETDPVFLGVHVHSSRAAVATTARPAAAGCVSGARRPSWTRMSLVSDRASIGSPL